MHHVAGPVDSQEARGRLAGWRSELLAAGAPVPEILRGDWTPSSGYAAGRKLAASIRAGEDVTAVFLANDQMALGLLAALHEEGLRVPDDVSVVGFDDLPGGAVLHPAADDGAPGLRRARPPRRPAGAGPAGRREPAPRAGACAPAGPGEHGPGAAAGALTVGRDAAMLTLTSAEPGRNAAFRLPGTRRNDVGDDAAAQPIADGRTALGIELGSTRIKAVLIGPDHAPLAVGSSRLGEPVRRPALDLLAGRGLGRGAGERTPRWPTTCGAGTGSS